MSVTIDDFMKPLTLFAGVSLTRTLAGIEASIRGLTRETCDAFLADARADRQVLGTAAELKRLAGQINMTIHALGILLCLPHILEPGEEVLSVSLGAGNTGRAFDLETNFRIAEFKFINWTGASEAVRENSVFKDYFLLADEPTPRRKYLYLAGTPEALKFLRGGRAISSVLSRNSKVEKLFAKRFGDRFPTVGDYYACHADAVDIVDISGWLGELGKIAPLQAKINED
jgi:hypothetical protein